MKQELYKCDHCGKVIKNGGHNTTIDVVTGRSMDASGNGYENDTQEIDLCLVCCAKVLRSLSRELDNGESISSVILSYKKR